MRLCIVGGKLQGLEAVYLSKKAGYDTLLVDRKSDVPAISLADEYYKVDVLAEPHKFKTLLKDVDAVLPALEDIISLVNLERLCNELSIPFMQDNSAFKITYDKILSQRLLSESGVPTPTPWPQASFPLIVKPARKSGSVGVHKVEDMNQLRLSIQDILSINDEPVIQEFIDGMALSLEVIAFGGNPIPLKITQLEFDDIFGCKRVFTPDLTSDDVRRRFIEISCKTARNLNLTGLMDVQALVDPSNNIPKVNEINARLPSQTPTVVYHSTGVNMVELLVEIFVKKRVPSVRSEHRYAAIYQHAKIESGVMKVLGEHIMAHSRNLEIKEDFMGLDEAITNIKEGESVEGKVITMIVKDRSLEHAWQRLNNAIENFKKVFKISKIIDFSPFKHAVFKLS